MRWVVAAAMMFFAATSSAAVAPPGPDSSGTVYPSEAALRAYAQARLLEARGAYRDALGEYYRALVVDHRSLHISRHVAELAARIGDNERALEFVERALRIEPDDPRSLWVKGSVLFNLGRGEEALETLEAATAADTGRVEYVLTLARVAEQLDRVDVVERAYSRAVRLDEDEGENWFQLAAAQARLGRFDLAERSLARATELEPARPGQLFLQGWVEESLGRPGPAIALYRHHLEVHPGDQTTRRRLVRLLASQHRWEEAHDEASRVAGDAPEDFEALEVSADLAFRARRAGEGRKAAEQLARMAGGDRGRLGRVVGLLLRHDRGAEAVRLADGWSAGHPDDVAGVLLAARVRAATGRLDEATELARQAVKAAPDSAAPRSLLGRLLVDRKRLDEAEGVLREARARFPDDLGLALDLAGCLEERGNVDGAEAAARDALRVAPADARAQNFLGYLLADHDRRLQEAEALILQAVAQDPDNGAYVDSLGWVYFRLGRLDEARESLERAVELTGGDPVVHEHLGDVYRALKLPEQARDQYRLSLAGDSSNERVRTKLGEIRQ